MAVAAATIAATTTADAAATTAAAATDRYEAPGARHTARPFLIGKHF